MLNELECELFQTTQAQAMDTVNNMSLFRMHLIPLFIQQMARKLYKHTKHDCMHSGTQITKDALKLLTGSALFGVAGFMGIVYYTNTYDLSSFIPL